MKKQNVDTVISKKNKILTGERGGAWTEKTHLRLHPDNFNFGLADYITHIIKPKSFLEFGSGLGFLARYIVDNLPISEVYCIEPNKIKGVYENNKILKLLPINIFTEAEPELIQRKFDLVISIEVAEHIERKLHDQLFDFLVNHSSNWIVFSGARIGQGGHGHIAERDEDEWKAEFIKRGMLFQEELTIDIRNSCDKKNINHRKNLMIFKNNEAN